MELATGDVAVRLSVKRCLLYLVCVHLAVLFLQLPLRAIVVDTTFWRDGLLLLTCGLWFLTALMVPRPFTMHRMDIAVATLFFYGVAQLVVGITTAGNAADRVLDFRNYFLPLLLYFPARTAFSVPRHRTMFVMFMFLFFAIFLLNPLVESAYRLTTLPTRWIPWYRYAFDHDDRFLGNSDTAYISPEDSPLLGLLGYPHYTAPALVALFAFVLPLFGVKIRRCLGDGRSQPLSMLSEAPQGIYLVLFVAAVALLGVRTHMVSALIVLFVLPSGGKAFKVLGYVGAAVVIAMLAVPKQVVGVLSLFAAGIVSDRGGPTSLGLILSVNEFMIVISAPLRAILIGFGPGFGASSDGPWELKLLYFTARLGVLWLLFFSIVVVMAFRAVLDTRRRYPKSSFQYRVAQGCFGMTVVYLLDAGHYMRLMAWPNLDLWVVSLALLGSIAEYRRSRREPLVDSVPTGHGPMRATKSKPVPVSLIGARVRNIH
jgi:hypothetical protein